MMFVNLPALALLNFSFVKSDLFEPFENMTFGLLSKLLSVMLKLKPLTSLRVNWQKFKGEPNRALPF